MNRTRRVLMVAVVASALAVDHFASAAPVSRPPVTEVARKLAGRLVVSFKRTIPAIRLREYRASEPTAQPELFPAVTASDSIPHFDFAPFQFRLPPPLI